MDESNSFPRKMSNSKLKLSDLNPHLMCVLCGGYYIDATTIVECLHSFCRSCIVKHLESSKYCPICEVQVHKTKPLVNIRADKTLQDIVYKLVPGLFANEMRSRRKFYRDRPHYIKPNNSESAGEVSGERKVYVNDENITFSLVYDGTGSVSGNDGYREIFPPIQVEKKYFKCPTGVTVYHLKKLLKTKYDLNGSNYKIEIYLKSQLLHEELTLLDISYTYLWKSKGNLDLTYKIFENVVKRQKMDESRFNGKSKEVEIESDARPNEIRPETIRMTNGEMSADSEAKKESAEVERRESSREPPSNLAEETIAAAENEAGSSTETETKSSEPCQPGENGVQGGESKEVQLRISESGVMSVSQVEDGEIVRTMEESPPKAAGNLSLGLQEEAEMKKMTEAVSVATSVGDDGERRSEGTKRIAGETQKKAATPKPVKPYKTIRCSPKAWHPVIPKEKLRPTLMKNSDEPKKPLKFFKMRNMPRFLGNPASGVKPMYAEPPENKVEHENKTREKKAENTRNKIIKIDPKTLRPIDKDEMTKLTQTPNVPNLLTNPFIPNNNHFLFSDLHLLPPNAGNFSSPKGDSPKGEKGVSGAFKTPPPNGSSSHPPICFPSPDHNPGFYPFSNLSKHQNFPFPVKDKMDPLLRASRLSPFANLTGFNVAGFHASLPPSISRLLNPHHHFRKISQSLEKKNKEGESGNDRDEGPIESRPMGVESTVEGGQGKEPTEKCQSSTEGVEKRIEKEEEITEENGAEEKKKKENMKEDEKKDKEKDELEKKKEKDDEKKEKEEEVEVKKKEEEENREEVEGKETGKSASNLDSISQDNNNRAIDRDKES